MKRKFIRSVFIFCTFLIFTNSYSQQDVNGWYWMTGRPTGNTLNWVKIINSSTLYAVGNFGTFMKSTDGGDTWSVNSQVGAIDNSSTGGLATRVLNTGWFFDANTGIVAGQSLSANPGVISRTTNAGATWTYIQYNASGGTVNDFHFINSTTGFLSGNSVALVRKTTDGGLTWNSITGNLTAQTYYSVFAQDANKIYVTAFPNLLYTTTNGGTSWSPTTLPGSNIEITDVIFKNATTGYVCGNANYFAYTTNGGTSWTQSNPPSSYGQREMRYSGGSVYLVGAWTEIYKSTNDGVSWSAINFIDNSNVNQPFQFYMYGIDVNGSDIAVVGNGGIVNLSNDDGASWRNKNYTVSNNNGSFGSENYSSLYAQPIEYGFSDDRIWIGPNGGGKILFSNNGGQNWTAQPTAHTTSIFDFDFINSTTGFAAGGNAFQGVGEVSKTTNSGLNWTLITLDPISSSQQINTVDFIDANTGWIFGGLPFGSGITCAKTTNGGATWVQQPNNINWSSTVSGKMADANTGWFVSGSVLCKTTNGGNNWIRNTDPYITSTAWSNLFVYDKDIIYLNGGGSSGLKKIIRSIDGGNTWTDLTSNLLFDATVFKTYWLNLKHGIVSGTNGYSAKTTNGGESWIESNPGGSTTVGLSLTDKNSWYTVSDRNSYFQAWRNLGNLTSISLNVTMAIEGFWEGKPMVTDTVTSQLRSSISPYGVVEQAKEVVNINGYATFEYYSAPAGSYYITLRHRNSIETWSSSPVAMTAGGNHNYDFTTSASQAYGNNTVLKMGKYCVYSGDVNQDEIVDVSDITQIYNDVVNVASGYIVTDVSGDDFVDVTDLLITYNNAESIITVLKP